MRETNYKLRKWVALALFAALAFTATLVIRIPVSFLTLDAKDAILVIAALLFGPAEGVFAALVTALIELISVSSTGLWGFLMNFCSSAAFAGVSALIYRRHKTANGALFGLAGGTVTTVGVMMLLNLLVTPLYTGMPREAVAAMIPTLLLPFNFAKCLLNSAIALILYKPVSVGMKRSRLLPPGDAPASYRLDRKTVVILLIAAGIAAVGVVLLLLL